MAKNTAKSTKPTKPAKSEKPAKAAKAEPSARAGGAAQATPIEAPAPIQTEALHHISYGMYIVSSVRDGRANAQVANTVFQVCSEPAALAVCLNKQNLTHEYVSASRRFVASVLSEQTPLEFIGRFGFRSGRDVDKLDGVKTQPGATGVPVVTENATAYLEVEVDRELDVWTHTMFVGKVVAAGVLSDGVPMSYAYYHQVKKGLTPRSAPSYVAPQKEK